TYGFPVADVEALLEKYPYAASFVAAMGSVDSTFTRPDSASEPLFTYLQQLAGPFVSCGDRTTVRTAAQQLLDSGAEALVVTDDNGVCHGVVTATRLLAWIASGAANPDGAIAAIGLAAPGVAGAETTVAEGAVRMTPSGAVVLTADGQQDGRVLALLTPRDLLPVLGDQPAAILDSITRAGSVPR